jgi:PAS domain S-box-containing protein
MKRRTPGVYGSVRVHHVPDVPSAALRTPILQGLLLLLSLFLFPTVRSNVPAQSNEPKRVLILLEEDLTWPIFREVYENTSNTLRAGAGGVLVFSEHMDRVDFPDPLIQSQRGVWIQRKYANTKLDLVVAAGEVPVDLFPNVPFLYLGMRDQPKVHAQLAAIKNSAGLWINCDAWKTVDLAKRLHPQAQQIVVIGGTSPAENSIVDQVRSQLADYSQMKVIYLTDLPFDVIAERMATLGPESISLFASLARDVAGRAFISAEAVSRISALSEAPVYGLLSTHVGTGAVGGYVTRFDELGKQAGEMGLQMLAGSHPEDVVAKSSYILDSRALQRWKIKESSLPIGTILVNRQPSLWESYKWYIVGAAFLCLLEALLILGLLWQRSKKIKYQRSLLSQMAFEKMLCDLSATFINLPEDQVGATIEESLGRIAKFLNLDRVTLFEYSQLQAEVIVSHSWRSTEVPHIPGILKIDKLDWLMNSFQSGGAIVVSDLEALPPEAFAEREYLRRLGTQSLAAFPLRAGDQSMGCIAFASTTRRVAWTDELIEQLKLLTEIFSNALARTRAQEACLRHTAIVESSDDAIISKDLNGIVLSWNTGAQQIFEYTSEEIVGQSIELLIPPFLRYEEKGILQSIRAGEHVEHYETIRTTKSGKRIDVSLTISPVRDSTGVIIGAAKIARNITDRKRAEQALRASEESLHTLSGRLIRAQEEERGRIARELHDDFSQRLAILGIGLGQLWRKLPESDGEGRAKILEMLRGTKEISSDIHSLSHQLHSSKLEHVGLGPALLGLCKEIESKYKIDVDFSDCGFPRDIPKDAALCLFRVAQESLSNIVKHSHAATAKVELNASDERISLRISDPGIGFDSGTPNPSTGIGLIGMSERLRLVGGKLTVDSAAYRGTNILAEVPFLVSVRETARIQVAGE